MNDWKDGLSDEQIKAASFIGKHARLIAGPGTGKTKTLTHRVLALILEHNVEPQKILVLTFTRVAAQNLKKEIKKVLEPINKENPSISTFHSFALRQLLKNSNRISELPKPLRIADDWEERWIIEEDLKLDMGDYLLSILPNIKQPIDKVKTLFNQLSTDWETLKIEQDEEKRICCDAKFIGAWENHRKIFGYTLRAELMYQLKRALNQNLDFELESDFKYVLIDEYQDLNACDMALVKELEKRGCELFVAGDDDQSIYGFRYADPVGIKKFSEDYNAEEFNLKTCYRCDKSILDIGEFVANLDVNRLPKKIEPRDNFASGEVHLQCYRNQTSEASGVAKRCKEILDKDANTEILLLLRSDYKGAMSEPLIDALKKEGVPVVVKTEENPLNSYFGRYVLSLIRLIKNSSDSLAWRTILQLNCPGIGSETQKALRDKASNLVITYSKVLLMCEDKDCGILYSDKINKKIKEVAAIIDEYKDQQNLSDCIHTLIKDSIHTSIKDSETGSQIQDSTKIAGDVDEYLQKIIAETEAKNFTDLVTAISTSTDLIEQQELVKGKVNIMTMHKAKGLSADVVFIVGAEKQFIPGKNIKAREEDDERRLLYVSITRARHELIITYCNERTGKQRYTGSESGCKKREITPFLKNAPLTVEQMN